MDCGMLSYAPAWKVRQKSESAVTASGTRDALGAPVFDAFDAFDDTCAWVAHPDAAAIARQTDAARRRDWRLMK
jgi:hypothetical protein